MDTVAIVSILFLIAVIDARTYRIPDVLVSFTLLLAACADIASWDLVSVGYRFLSACMILIVLLAARKTVGHLGLGDVKLLTALAYEFGIDQTLAAFLVSAVACLIAYSINARRLVWTANTRIPFAPFIFAGCAIASVARGVMAYE